MRLRRIPGADAYVKAHEKVVQEIQDRQGAWNELFPQKQPLHMEIGMGKGQFLLNMALQHPDINYIGVERYESVLYKALKRMDTEPFDKLSNIRFLCIDAAWLPEIFARGEIEKIYLNFSDPWPKAAHARRRLTSPDFLLRFEAVLTPGGLLEFKTDNLDLFQYSLEKIEESRWELVQRTFNLHEDSQMVEGNIMTEYEEKFSSLGNPIYKLIAKNPPEFHL